MLKQKLILSYGVKIAMQFVQVAVTIVVARVAGAEVLGTVAFGLAYVSMFIFISDLGLGSAHIKLVSEGRDEAACNGTYVRLQGIFVAVFFVVVLLFFLSQKYLLGYHFESAVHEQVILVTLAAVTITRAFFIFQTCFSSKTQQARQDIPTFIELIVFQSLRLLVVLLGYQALAIAFTRLTAVIVMVPVYFYLFRDFKVGKFDKKLAKQYFLISLPVLVTDFVDSLTTYIDKVLLQHMTNSAEVGYYVAGFKIGSFILMIGASVGLLFFPTFSKAIAQKSFQRVNDISRKFERFSLAFVFPVTAVLSINADVIVNTILGSQYAKSIPVLSIINISAFTFTFITPYGNVLSGDGRFKLIAKLYIADLIFFLTLVYLMVSPGMFNLGSTGLAAALLFAKVFLGVLFIFSVRAKLKEIHVLPGFKLLLFGVLYSGLAFWLYQGIQMTLLYKALFSLAYFAGYWGLGMLFRLIPKQDWLMLAELINLKKMLSYVKSEMKTDGKDKE